MKPDAALDERGVGFLGRLAWKRLTFWAGFIGILCLLHDFLDVLFFTFVFTFICGRACGFLARLFECTGAPGQRRAMVIAFYGLIAGLLTVGISIAYPHVLEQGKVMIKRVGDVSIWAEAMAETEEPPPADPEATASSGAAPAGSQPLFAGAALRSSELGKWPKERVERLLWRFLGQEAFDPFRESSIYTATLGITQNLLNAVMPPLTQRLGRVFEDFLRYMVNLYLALLLSLILVLELPKLREMSKALEESRLGGFYREILPSLVSLATILGKAFEAQALVAVVNTALTAIGLVVLGVPHAFVLSGIVFVCSFIPVLGVVISTVPIALSALREGGGMLVLYVVLWIAGVYALKAYLLYPRIVGTFMRVHPVFAVVILIAAQELFGLWGLILGVPLCYYLYHHWIKGDDEEIARIPLGPQRAKEEGHEPAARGRQPRRLPGGTRQPHDDRGAGAWLRPP
jgi:predicted PurR-regulated permease PerM